MTQVEVLHRLERSYVKGVRAAPNGISSEPFLIHLNPESKIPWLNNAVLDDDTAPLDIQAIGRMMDVFLLRDRTPRMELFKELRPKLLELLVESGFEVESETPVMVCSKASFRPSPALQVAVELLTPDSDPRPFMRAVDTAFNSEYEITPERIERFRQSLRRGSAWVAQASLEGSVVGGATLVPSDDTAELAGVGTHPGHRRRGVALAVSSFLLDKFFRAGDLVWLSAADDAARATYEKLGFTWAGTQVNIGFRGRSPVGPVLET